MNNLFLRVTKKLLFITVAVCLLFFMFNLYLIKSLNNCLSESQFEYVQCSRHAEVISIDYCKLPERLKAELSHLVINSAKRSLLDINSYVLGVSVVKRDVSVNLHPNFIVYNFDRHNFTWQLTTYNTKEGGVIFLELQQLLLAHAKGDSTYQE